MFDVVFYEVFKEEEKTLEKFLPAKIRARFVSKTIQECREALPSARLISVRTQSRIPREWAAYLDGVFTRRQGRTLPADTSKNIVRGRWRNRPCS